MVLLQYVEFASDISIVTKWLKKGVLKDLKELAENEELRYETRGGVLLMDVVDWLDRGKEILDAVLDLLTRIDDRFLDLKSTTRRIRKGSLFNLIPMAAEFTSYVKEMTREYERRRKPHVVKLDSLSKEIVVRLNEAFHGLLERCCYSAVVNCGVALESRLLLLLKQRNAQFLKTIDQKLRFTFGQLIATYIKHPHQFHHCIPQRYQKLLELVNSYRVVSAHPKGIRVDMSTADAVFNLALRFLLDDECQPLKRRRLRRGG